MITTISKHKSKLLRNNIKILVFSFKFYKISYVQLFCFLCIIYSIHLTKHASGGKYKISILVAMMRLYTQQLLNQSYKEKRLKSFYINLKVIITNWFTDTVYMWLKSIATTCFCAVLYTGKSSLSSYCHSNILTECILMAADACVIRRRLHCRLIQSLYN